MLLVGSTSQAQTNNDDSLMLNTRSLMGDPDWSRRTWSGDGEFGSDSADDSQSLHLSSIQGGDISWSIHASVQPDAVYRLSAKINTEDVVPTSGRGALINIHQMAGAQTKVLTGTNKMQSVEFTFRTGSRDDVLINCLLGGWGEATGKVSFEDLRLEQIDVGKLRPDVTVYADRERPAMHPFIYGQFIEHMGRCIYGGIWAEMLEDRKFYFPITEDYAPYTGNLDTDYPIIGRSPWQIIGNTQSVTMTKQDPFVGAQAPQLSEGSGIRQHDLALESGMRYVGYIWIKASVGEPTVNVILDSAGDAVKIEQLTQEYRRYPFEFLAGADRDDANLSIEVEGGDVVVGTLSLMPADNVRGMRSDTLALLKKLDSPIYRWPGGNFVSGYDWRDGIGDRDRRPPRTNPAWTGIEPNDFGMHEFIDFCRELDTEPLITINLGFEGAFSAEAEMEYVNGTTGYWAEKRAEHGAPDPFGVQYWCIGNEMWGAHQLGHIPLAQYVMKHNWVVERLRERFPDFVSIASGDAGPWSKGLLEGTARNTDWIAEHFYIFSPRDDVAAHVQQLPQSIRSRVEFHRQTQARIPGLVDRPIPIAMTEWNYWYGPHPYGELGTRYYLRDALGIAAGLNEYSRSTDIVAAAFYAQTVNVIGAIKTTPTEAFLATTALPLIMYREHFGTIPVEVDTGHSELLGLDVAAAWEADRSALTLAVVNGNGEPVDLGFAVEGSALADNATVWRMAGTDPDAYNDADNLRLDIVEQKDVQIGESVRVPPYSASIYRIPVR